jgi:hypothetical protein
MKTPKLEIGAEVKFELAEDVDNPRWDFNTDRKGSGVWKRGVIVDIEHRSFRVRWDGEHGEESWNWPNIGFEEYDPQQWNRPGFVQLVKKLKYKIVDMGSHYATQAQSDDDA